MKKFRKTTLIIIWALFIGIIFLKPVFAETSISAIARCTVPEIVTLSSGEKILVGSGKKIEEDTNIAEVKKDEEQSIAENKTNYIQQKEEVVSEVNEEVQSITTVCAK